MKPTICQSKIKENLSWNEEIKVEISWNRRNKEAKVNIKKCTQLVRERYREISIEVEAK